MHCLYQNLSVVLRLWLSVYWQVHSYFRLLQFSCPLVQEIPTSLASCSLCSHLPQRWSPRPATRPLSGHTFESTATTKSKIEILDVSAAHMFPSLQQCISQFFSFFILFFSICFLEHNMSTECLERYGTLRTKVSFFVLYGNKYLSSVTYIGLGNGIMITITSTPKIEYSK